EVDVRKADVVERRFAEPEQHARLLGIAGDTAYVNVPEPRRSVGHRLGRYIAIPRQGLPGVVKHVERDRLAADVLHDDVADAHVLHDAPATSFGLDPDATVGSLEDAIGD